MELPTKQNELEAMSVDKLLDTFGAMTFTIALLLREKTNECGGCVGMNLLGVFVDANHQAEEVFYHNQKRKEEDN